MPASKANKTSASNKSKRERVRVTCRRTELRRNCDAKPGDVLILNKGRGVYLAAFKKGALTADAYTELIASTTLLNRIGADLACDAGVHAITDVTGVGLLGHGLKMARGSTARLVIHADDLPVLAHAANFVQQGFVTGASERNRASYGTDVVLPNEFPKWRHQV